MSKEKKTHFHIVYKTEEDLIKENEELGRNVTEDKKSEYVFNGEDLYFLGRGHDFLRSFFGEYITRGGLRIRHYDYSNKWIIKGDEYRYVDGEFVLIPPPPPPTPPREPVDFSNIQFPIVKNVQSNTLADDLTSIKPKRNFS